MAKSKVTKKIFTMAYGIGASVVILGALFKILHWEIFGINGGVLLAFGLVTEAIIFFISAFEPVEDDYDWATVFPELAGGEPRRSLGVSRDENLQSAEEDKLMKETLAEKLDIILSEAKVDANLMKSLKTSIESFSDVAKEIAPVATASASVQRYGNELASAATNLESLNALYKLQLDRTENQLSVQSSALDKMNLLNEEMLELKSYIANLNDVYGGMLNVMGGRK